MMPPMRPTDPNAASLRRNATDCEKMVWQALRNRQVEGCKFRRQATIGPYIVDFLCVELRLIEIDGGHHGEDVDRTRTTYSGKAGYRVHRFWNHDVTGNFEGVMGTVRNLLIAARPFPNKHWTPPPKRG